MSRDKDKEEVFEKMSFQEMLLIESISITQTPYGMNNEADNEVIRKHSDIAFTKFVHEGVYVEVIFDRHMNSLNYQIRTFNDKAFSKHSESPIKIKNMSSLLGKLLFVFKKIADLLNIKKFYFSSFATEKQVSALYRTFVKSKQLPELMKQIGFQYVKTKKPSVFTKVLSSGEVSDEHWFEKIK